MSDVSAELQQVRDRMNDSDTVLVVEAPDYDFFDVIDVTDDDPDFDPYEADAIAASAGEFREVPRDADGRWTKGGGGGRPIPPPPPRRPAPQAPPGVLEDVDFNEVQIAYRPRHPDGKGDPGEIVWAKVPFEEDPTQSKDRPVLIIGRTKDGQNLVGVQLTSKAGRDGERLPVGSGDWDKQGRESFLKLDRFVQVDDVNYRREGSYMKKPAFQKVVDELTERQGTGKIQLAVRRFGRGRPLGLCVGCGGYFATDVPRANDGKWCKGSGCSGGAAAVERREFPNDSLAREAAFAHTFPADINGPEQEKIDDDVAAHANLRDDLLDNLNSDVGEEDNFAMYEAWEAYTGEDSRVMNRRMRYGETSEVPSAAKTVDGWNTHLNTAFDEYGQPTDSTLYRGETSGRRQGFNMNVGDEYVDNGFGSFTVNPTIARSYTGQGADRRSVLTKVNGGAPRTLPGTDYEFEMVTAPGTRFRVTDVVDFVGPGEIVRVVEVEAS